MLSDFLFLLRGKGVNAHGDETSFCCSSSVLARAQSIPGAAAPTPACKARSWHSNTPWAQQGVVCAKGAGKAPDLEKYTNTKKKVADSLGQEPTV